jgi:hypothetical protein
MGLPPLLTNNLFMSRQFDPSSVGNGIGFSVPAEDPLADFTWRHNNMYSAAAIASI